MNYTDERLLGVLLLLGLGVWGLAAVAGWRSAERIDGNLADITPGCAPTRSVPRDDLMAVADAVQSPPAFGDELARRRQANR